MTESFTFHHPKTGEPFTATLVIDTEQLARQLARDARRNKSRKAKLGGGCIVVAVAGAGAKP